MVRRKNTTKNLEFQKHGKKEIVGNWEGGTLTVNAGGLLLREVEKKVGIVKKYSNCFIDHRDPKRIEHSVYELLCQRIFGLCLGYEDLNDHDELMKEEFWALLVGKEDLSGQNRRRAQDKGKALAGRSSLSRLERSGPELDLERQKKIITKD